MCYVFVSGHRNFRPGGFQVQLRQHDRVPDRRRRGRGCARDFARHGALPAGGAQHFKQITYHPGESLTASTVLIAAAKCETRAPPNTLPVYGAIYAARRAPFDHITLSPLKVRRSNGPMHIK